MAHSLHVVLVFMLSLNIVLGAKFCYSGRGQVAPSKQCGNGNDSDKYICQTFKCEGGRSPFTLRTCASKNMNCLAGPAICKYSGGTGSCGRCDNNNCNAL